MVLLMLVEENDEPKPSEDDGEPVDEVSSLVQAMPKPTLAACGELMQLARRVAK